jgi:hypothetical protein
MSSVRRCLVESITTPRVSISFPSAIYPPSSQCVLYKGGRIDSVAFASDSHHAHDYRSLTTRDHRARPPLARPARCGSSFPDMQELLRPHLSHSGQSHMARAHSSAAIRRSSPFRYPIPRSSPTGMRQLEGLIAGVHSREDRSDGSVQMPAR